MNEKKAFLSAILAKPGDDTARLAFAVWLDEHDDPERADHFASLTQGSARFAFGVARFTLG